ncbi:M13-type metalloendopeptidase [Mycoplasmopsis gallinarum]
MKPANIKDDLYYAVNAEWQEKAKIPADKTATGAFYEIYKTIRRKEKMLAANLIKNLSVKPNENEQLNNLAKFYEMALDYETRNKLGIKPLKEIVKKVTNLKDLNDYITKLHNFELREIPSFFDFSIYSDFKNSENQILYLGNPSIILPENSFYDDSHPMKNKFLNAYKKMATKLLQKFAFNPKKIGQIVENVLSFDRKILEFHPTGQELVNYIAFYNPRSLEELNAYEADFKLGDLAKKLVNNQNVDFVSVTYPRFFENLNKILNNQTFDEFKDWLLIKTLRFYSPYLDRETEIIGKIYTKVSSGIKKLPDRKNSAFDLMQNYFGDVLGLYFAQKYFGEKGKIDVENKVAKMIEIYRQRLSANTWLSESTKEKAIIKLNKLKVKIGYPSKLKPYYDNFETKTEKANLVDNIILFNTVLEDYSFSQYGTKIDPEYWSMSASAVNAYYAPNLNQIVFPAGILNEPFYSLKQSSSANYGGIGAVIAHEISHAFDNHGAQFDENGNLNMWWTEEDFAKFNKLGEKMVDLFEGQPTEFGLCNGKLTLSENIADNGGISCALAASQLDADHDSKEFFISWAKIWRIKQREERAKILLSTDPHAPGILRANIQAKNLDEFQNIFEIQPEDKMYLAPDKRVKIW